MRFTFHRIVILLLAAGSAIAGCGWLLRAPPAAPLDHDAYIWQMRWSPELRQSILSNRDIVHGWRVLIAQAREPGQLHYPDLDIATLRNSDRPVIAVIRIEGQITQLDAPELLPAILDRIRQLRASGLALAGVEIDYDCATAQLPRYRAFLMRMRKDLGPEARLSITALPTWLGSPALPELLAATDEAVLQVHAVSDPRMGGLFDPERARSWVERFARITPHPFRVALPTYGARLNFDTFGNLAGVESEANLLAGGVRHEELIVTPLSVQTLLRGLQRDPPPQLRGIVWFRLPVQGDVRAWDAQTWRALIRDTPLATDARLAARVQQDPALYDILLRNPADVDVTLPARIPLPPYCSMADGANGYTFAMNGNDKQALVRAQFGLLRPRQERVIGWARCNRNPQADLHATP